MRRRIQKFLGRRLLHADTHAWLACICIHVHVRWSLVHGCAMHILARADQVAVLALQVTAMSL
jgi:hypothetical protein